MNEKAGCFLFVIILVVFRQQICFFIPLHDYNTAPEPIKIANLVSSRARKLCMHDIDPILLLLFARQSDAMILDLRYFMGSFLPSRLNRQLLEHHYLLVLHSSADDESIQLYFCKLPQILPPTVT